MLDYSVSQCVCEWGLFSSAGEGGRGERGGRQVPLGVPLTGGTGVHEQEGSGGPTGKTVQGQ